MIYGLLFQLGHKKKNKYNGTKSILASSQNKGKHQEDTRTYVLSIAN